MESNNLQHGGTSQLDAVDNYFRSLPPGYRFCPRNDELIQYYLKKKVLEQELPINRIHCVNIYAHHPQDLAETYPRVRELDWFFFSPREKKYLNGNLPNRSALGGFWKAAKTEVDITAKSGQIIGCMMKLDFYEGKQAKGLGKKTNWKMYEYTLKNEKEVLRRNNRIISEDSSGMKLNDYVVCKIYIKKNGKVDETNYKAKTSDQSTSDIISSVDQQGVALINVTTSDDQNPVAIKHEQPNQYGAHVASQVNWNGFSSSTMNNNFDYHQNQEEANFGSGLHHVESISNNNFSNNQNNYTNNMYYQYDMQTSHGPSAYGHGFPCVGSSSSSNNFSNQDTNNHDMHMMQSIHDPLLLQSFAYGSGFHCVGSSSRNNFSNPNYPDNNIMETNNMYMNLLQGSLDPSSSQPFGSRFPSIESCTELLEPTNQEIPEVNDPSCSIALPAEHVRDNEGNDHHVAAVLAGNEGDDVPVDGEYDIDQYFSTLDDIVDLHEDEVHQYSHDSQAKQKKQKREKDF